MISITKNEMEYLTKECGVKFGENGISHTWGHRRHYFLCESRYNTKKLFEYRKRITISTHTR